MPHAWQQCAGVQFRKPKIHTDNLWLWAKWGSRGWGSIHRHAPPPQPPLALRHTGSPTRKEGQVCTPCRALDSRNSSQRDSKLTAQKLHSFLWLLHSRTSRQSHEQWELMWLQDDAIETTAAADTQKAQHDRQPPYWGWPSSLLLTSKKLLSIISLNMNHLLNIMFLSCRWNYTIVIYIP